MAEQITIPLDPKAKGTYILILHKDTDGIVKMGKTREHHFSKGYYGYVGSAMGGLASRLRHHCSISEKPHWHIDWLRYHTSIDTIIYGISDKRIECGISSHLALSLDPIPRFGASDCTCRSHLYHHMNRDTLLQTAIRAFAAHGITTHAITIH